MNSVILKGFIIVPPNDLAAVKNELDNHIQLTRSETGCLIFEVTQDPLNPCRFDVYEEFADQAAFQAHQARVKSSRWGDITVNVERHYTVTGIG
jgi:autoinducer 2-degrading protein